MPKPSLTASGAADKILREGASWAEDMGQATSVSFAFRATAPSYDPEIAPDFAQFTAQQIAISLLAFQAWSDVARITFTRVGSGSSGPGAYSDNASILLGGIDEDTTWYSGYAYLPGENGTPGDRGSGASDGDVWINNAQSAGNPALWNRGFLVLTHEIGHAIGLHHPGDYNRAPGVQIDYEAHAEYAEDTVQYSIMSYFSESHTGGDYNGFYPVAPQLHDIAAAQRLYGANTATRTGDTVYGFNSTADRPWFSATGAASPLIFAAWDAGGRDTFDFSGYAQAQRIDLGAGRFSDVGALKGNVAVALGAVIENAVGGSGADRITGNAAANSLAGGAGADTLEGLEGNDTLAGGTGADTLNGGLGFDLASFAGAAARVIVNLAAQTMSGADAADVLISVEAVEGTGLDDILTGSGVADTLIGGAGNDVLDGAAGADRLDGGLGTDTVRFLTGEGALSVNLGSGQAGGAGTDTLIGIENAVGGALGDTLVGSTASNLLEAGKGDDLLDGGGGNDTLDGGEGIDTVRFQAHGSAGVSANLTTGQATGAGTDTLIGIEHLTGGAGADRFTGGAGANTLLGQSGADRLLGVAGNDALQGGDGADTLTGGAGADQLSGGLGVDVFVFTAAADSGPGASDLIADLTRRETIDLSAIDADSDQGGDQAFVMVRRFTGEAGELTLKLQASSGDTFLRGDIDGDGQADFVLRIEGDHDRFGGLVL